MTNNIALIRSLLVYAICIPLAIVLGYMITDPLDRTTDYGRLAIVLFLLVLPKLLLRWYHAWLIVIWNMSITFIYMPGFVAGAGIDAGGGGRFWRGCGALCAHSG